MTNEINNPHEAEGSGPTETNRDTPELPPAPPSPGEIQATQQADLTASEASLGEVTDEEGNQEEGETPGKPPKSALEKLRESFRGFAPEPEAPPEAKPPVTKVRPVRSANDAPPKSSAPKAEIPKDEGPDVDKALGKLSGITVRKISEEEIVARFVSQEDGSTRMDQLVEGPDGRTEIKSMRLDFPTDKPNDLIPKELLAESPEACATRKALAIEHRRAGNVELKIVYYPDTEDSAQAVTEALADCDQVAIKHDRPSPRGTKRLDENTATITSVADAISPKKIGDVRKQEGIQVALNEAGVSPALLGDHNVADAQKISSARLNCFVASSDYHSYSKQWWAEHRLAEAWGRHDRRQIAAIRRDLEAQITNGNDTNDAPTRLGVALPMSLRQAAEGVGESLDPEKAQQVAEEIKARQPLALKLTQALEADSGVSEEEASLLTHQLVMARLLERNVLWHTEGRDDKNVFAATAALSAQWNVFEEHPEAASHRRALAEKIIQSADPEALQTAMGAVEKALSLTLTNVAPSSKHPSQDLIRIKSRRVTQALLGITRDYFLRSTSENS